MSRSSKKHPGFGITTSKSDKPYKEAEHRRERRRMRQVIGDDPDVILGELYGNRCKAPKDGKQWWAGAKEKDMRE